VKHLMTGNEAIARGCYEAGVTVTAAYPGTPSTEILENMAQYKEDIYSEWSPNEKVAMEVAIGASIAGARSLAAMKHVGVNVAADAIFTYAYTGVNGGFVFVSADDPGMHSSQNEQDNRHFARHAKFPMLEPSDSQEAKDFTKEAFEISEKFDVPVMLRVTTRICHSKTPVSFEDRVGDKVKPYEKNIKKYVATPANGRVLHVLLEKKLIELEKFSNETSLNRIEWNDKTIGIITSGVAYEYAKEVFGEDASYFKIGFSYPLPMEKIKSFAKEVDTLYVIEELEPFMEEQMKANGIQCIGKEKIPNVGELSPHVIEEALKGTKAETLPVKAEKAVPRPPVMCAGCPHRGFFYELSRKKNIMVTGDIGCYTLGSAEPLNAMDTCICMGASVSAGHGAQVAFNKNKIDKKVVGVIGDSTFFHSGITGLLDIVYNRGNVVTVILDNRITGMTGHQENPGTGYTLMGEEAPVIDIASVVKACGVKHIETVNPNNLKESKEALDRALASDEPSVLITRWPCVLKNFSKEDIEEFDLKKTICKVNEEKCTTCKVCGRVGCPAISFDEKAKIDPTMCVGCEVCLQVCPFKAIEKVGE